jgi:hypothetical protein
MVTAQTKKLDHQEKKLISNVIIFVLAFFQGPICELYIMLSFDVIIFIIISPLFYF